MATTKYSRQREAIIHFLQSRTDHPTAEVIYQNLRRTNPNISLGTVYRNLAKLSEAGVILKINCNDASDHFDGNPKPHGHFICKSCHSITDFTTENLHFDSVIEENHFEGIITESHVLFYGICKDCMKQQPHISEGNKTKK